jgi:hypothetical protein
MKCALTAQISDAPATVIIRDFAGDPTDTEVGRVESSVTCLVAPENHHLSRHQLNLFTIEGNLDPASIS